MEEHADQEFLQSVFLMEAWDTLTVIEDGIDGLMVDAAPKDELYVVTHRLKGTASLYGFLEVAGLAQAMEQALSALPDASAEVRSSMTARLRSLADKLKDSLDAIGSSSVPVNGHVAGHVDPVRVELQRFFENVEVVEYFRPEAAEHLDDVAAALEELGRRGNSEDLVGRLLRRVHTLKGSALVVGCAPVGTVAHRLEDLLVDVRAGRLSLTPAMVETMFFTVETMRTMLRIVPDNATNLTEVIDRLMATLTAFLSVSGPPTQAAPEEAPGAPEEAPAAPEESAVVFKAIPTPPVPSAAPRQFPRTVRVNLERLDNLMDIVGEFLVTRRRLDRRLSDLDRMRDVLLTSRGNLERVLAEFERQHEDLPGSGEPEAAMTTPLTSTRPFARDLFSELEFERYDDVALLTRKMREISADLTEAQSELTGLQRSTRNELAELQHLGGRLREEISRARLLAIGPLLTRFVRQGEQAARAAGKTVRIVASGGTVALDVGIIEQIIDPVFHLIQNALVHGIESSEERIVRGKSPDGTITLTASHRGAYVYIEVGDDGRGIDTAILRRCAVAQGFLTVDAAASLSEGEALQLIFLPGFSTASTVTPAAGRGVGLDVVRANVERLNGQVEIHTEVGTGSRLGLRLPITLIVSDALTVRAGDERFAIPLNAVRRVAMQPATEIRATARGETVVLDDESIDLIYLDRALMLPGSTRGAQVKIVLVHAGSRVIALAVDDIVEKEEIVIKSLGRFLEGVGPFAGATITSEGRVNLLLDPVKLIETATRVRERPTAGDVVVTALVPASPGAPRVLLVDDSISVRKFVGQMLDRAGFDVATASDGVEALARIADASFDVVITDLEMPRINGYELLDNLRRRPETQTLPVIVLTTRSGEKHASLARQLGASHYVTKPVEEHSFISLVARLLASARDHDVGAMRP